MLSLCLDVPIGSSTKSEEIIDLAEKAVEDSNRAMTVSYYAEFDCRELPEEGYMQLELIGKNEGQLYADLKFVIKVILRLICVVHKRDLSFINQLYYSKQLH